MRNSVQLNCRIYVSNRSDRPIYFDNLKVAFNRGRIIEENHYYAYGLKIAAISSNKLSDALYEGHLENRNLYNDKELLDDGGIDLYEFGYRMYDAQIGRFIQIDPLTDDYPNYSGYLFAGNNPIRFTDYLGLGPVPSAASIVFNGWQETANIASKVGSGLAKAGIIASIGVNVANKTSTVLNMPGNSPAVKSPINNQLRANGQPTKPVKCHPESQKGGNNPFSKGTGTRQKFGYVLKGNSPHSKSATDNFVDDAEHKELLDLDFFIKNVNNWRLINGAPSLIDFVKKFKDELNSVSNFINAFQAFKDAAGDPNLQPKNSPPNNSTIVIKNNSNVKFIGLRLGKPFSGAPDTLYVE